MLDILKSIQERNPALNTYLKEKEGRLKIELVQMDATDMNRFKDSSISGINASALVHEIYSYVPLKNNLDIFFKELARVLEPNGIFVYRDPKWDDKPFDVCKINFKETISKYFALLFLPKFLDRLFTQFINSKNECLKPIIYESCFIEIHFTKKNSNEIKKINLRDFLNIPLKEIDFSKDILIKAPRGLAHEIQRHYVLFIKNVFEESPNQDTDLNNSSFKISLDQFIKNGFKAKIKDLKNIQKECNKIYKKGISKKLLQVKNNELFIDAKLAVLLFKGTNSEIFKFLEEIDDKNLIKIFEWLKREGEEFYFYKTTDELITYVGQITSDYLRNSLKNNYILCPILIKTSSRKDYKQFLNKSMHIINANGSIENLTTKKNIIHFKLIKIEEALKIYTKIIVENPNTFQILKNWLIRIFSFILKSNQN